MEDQSKIRIDKTKGESTRTIEKNLNGNSLTLNLAGRLDTTTAPELEAVVDNSLAGVQELVLDMEKLEYISSAGLRVILKAQKMMVGKGSMKLIHVNDTIMEVFDITGFVDILTIE